MKYQHNGYIKRYCELVVEINELTKYLDKEYEDFYYGGHTFEQCYATDIETLHKLEGEFIDILNMLKNN